MLHAAKPEGKRLARWKTAAAADEFINQAAWGTPAQVIKKIQGRRDVIGDYSVMFSPTWGGLPYDLAHESMKLVSEKVLPELRTNGA